MDNYKKFIKEKFDLYKCKQPYDVIIQIPIIAFLKPIIKEFQMTDPDLPTLLTKWRKENPTIGTGTFKMTIDRTEKWLFSHIINRDDRLLFMIYSKNNVPIGHIGFSNVDYENKIPELDSVLRGVKNVYPGIMGYATYTLIEWGYRNFGFKRVNLSVFSDNEKAIRFYERNGFVKKTQKPLYKIQLDDEIKWEFAPANYTGPIEKYYLYMQYKKDNFDA